MPMKKLVESARSGDLDPPDGITAQSVSSKTWSDKPALTATVLNFTSNGLSELRYTVYS